jgi:hypothetical protein
MSSFKKWLLLLIVAIALFQTGMGGMADMFGVSLFNVSPQHGWTDGLIMMLLAIVVAIAVR